MRNRIRWEVPEEEKNLSSLIGFRDDEMICLKCMKKFKKVEKGWSSDCRHIDKTFIFKRNI